MKLRFPVLNADSNATGGYNYVQSQIFIKITGSGWPGETGTSATIRKVFIRYNYQREVQQFPVGLRWRNGDQVPYPTPILGKNKSNSWTGTVTHVFSPTMTNETIVSYSFIGFPNVFSDPKKVDRAAVGYGYAGLSLTGKKPISQIPSFGAFGPSGRRR